ncbi:hypothetical protein [Flavivirga algicola]|uniref:Tetratricopeptide repeat protein n=1 Tax=Flavivirga algicola TaxID=2729136 RepID=A0ABX1S014_9FLAO|nr:hypothetical protein [Flavivirga algicola]NMH87982.1 hypothetical protein [Flavivirga algicola]
MNVTGETNLEVFLELIQLVIKKSGIRKPLNEFKGHEQNTLADKIKSILNPNGDIYPISANAIRDYRFMSDPDNWKYPFSVSEGKLDVLCQYIEEVSWKRFVSDRIDGVIADFNDSFYRSDNIFPLIYEKASEINNMIIQGEKLLKQNNNSVEILFNIGVGLLFKGYFKKAENLFNKCCDLESHNSKLHFFKSLSLLDGKRPFRHKKIRIDGIIEHLNKSIQFNSEGITYYSELLHLIYQDFHQRIGYSYQRIRLTKHSPQLEWLQFLEICTGIPYKEIEKTLI